MKRMTQNTQNYMRSFWKISIRKQRAKNQTRICFKLGKCKRKQYSIINPVQKRKVRKKKKIKVNNFLQMFPHWLNQKKKKERKKLCWYSTSRKTKRKKWNKYLIEMMCTSCIMHIFHIHHLPRIFKMRKKK